MLGSQLIVSFIIAVIGSLLIMALGMAAYHPELPVSVALLVPAFFLGTICFASFGFFLGAVLPSTRSAQGVGLLLFFIMMILGGAGPPPEVLKGAMGIVAGLHPCDMLS